jgi:phosphomannomutase
MPADVNRVVKTYDVRGLVDSELTDDIVEALAAAFVDVVGARGTSIIVGHDMRDSSPRFVAAFSRGARARGADIVLIGLCSTDETYFASGSWNLPSAMFTASHNPSSYNGIKLSRAGAQSLSADTGLFNVRDLAHEYLQSGIPQHDSVGTESERDVLSDYASYLRKLVDVSTIRPLRIVVDAGNGMAGLTVPAVLETAAGLSVLPIDVIPMFFELDGSFPNHEANPLNPDNIIDLQRAVIQHGADMGLAFDGDADRCFVVDERGEPVSPSAVAALVAVREVHRVSAAGETSVTVLHNLITSDIVPQTIHASGARAVRTNVGHSLIKDIMRETGAVFGGEHSAHYYFRDFWGADNGMLAALHVIAELGAGAEPLSVIASRFSPYVQSGEINSVVADVDSALLRIREAFTGRGEFDSLDGLTVSSKTRSEHTMPPATGDERDFWWFNVRASNTEPLLRLNVESGSPSRLESIRDEVLALIRQN